VGMPDWGKIVKIVELLPVPLPDVTVMVPVAVAVGVAKIVFALTTLNDTALTPPNCTTVVPVKFEPLMLIGTSGHPLLGIELMMGTGGHDTPETKVAPTEAPPYPTL